MPLGRLVAILYLEALAGAAPAPELDGYGGARKVARAASELGDVEGLRHAAGGTAYGELPGGVHADVLPSFTAGVESLPPPCDLPASLSTPLMVVREASGLRSHKRDHVRSQRNIDRATDVRNISPVSSVEHLHGVKPPLT